ncbi:chorismate mutase [Pseudonocardia sediminis]|uniref:chorismate mutase n=1 Tax=Pseudonocardia sediminis TaxID=1397368 RepID=A0A4Q7UU01_PSEST|nr:gamma subclass chorismate mutase AroQ [Pseudonocardia sediminis]RZT84281.1 chorismate mutase [Pseudonocardia sediminis]
MHGVVTRLLVILAMVSTVGACAGGPPAAPTTGPPPSAPAAVPSPPPAPTAGLTGLTHLAARRIALSDTVAAAKFGTPTPIEDPVREQQVVDAAGAAAARDGLDPAGTQAFFRDQIEASKVVQRGLFRLWADRADLRPRARPGLAAVRPELDRIGAEMVTQLRVTTPARTAESCPAELSSDAASVGSDALHREALGVALRSVCRG